MALESPSHRRPCRSPPSTLAMLDWHWLPTSLPRSSREQHFRGCRLCKEPKFSADLFFSVQRKPSRTVALGCCLAPRNHLHEVLTLSGALPTDSNTGTRSGEARMNCRKTLSEGPSFSAPQCPISLLQNKLDRSSFFPAISIPLAGQRAGKERKKKREFFCSGQAKKKNKQQRRRHDAGANPSRSGVPFPKHTLMRPRKHGNMATLDVAPLPGSTVRLLEP